MAHHKQQPKFEKVSPKSRSGTLRGKKEGRLEHSQQSDTRLDEHKEYN